MERVIVHGEGDRPWRGLWSIERVIVNGEGYGP